MHEDAPVPDDVAQDQPTGYAFTFAVVQHPAMAVGDDLSLDGRGYPVPGVTVAVDVPGADRQELYTDRDGTVRVELPPGAARVTLTAARPGWRPVTTIYQATIAELEDIGASTTGVTVFMSPWSPSFPPASYAVTVRSLEQGYYASVLGEEDYVPGTGHTFTVPASPARLRAVAYQTDQDGRAVRIAETVAQDVESDQSLMLWFKDVAPGDLRDVLTQVVLPRDPRSILRSGGYRMTGHFPLRVLHPDDLMPVIGGTYAASLTGDRNAIYLAAFYLPPHDAKAPLFEASLCMGAGPCKYFQDAFTVRYENVLPPDGMEVLDIPLMHAIPEAREHSASTAFYSQPIEGAATYDLIVTDTHRTGLLWVIRALHPQVFALPKLPSGFDRSSEWPGVAWSAVRIRACNRWEAVPLRYYWAPHTGLACSASPLDYITW